MAAELAAGTLTDIAVSAKIAAPARATVAATATAVS